MSDSADATAVLYLSGDKRREIREACGVSKRELAKAVGTTHASITMWEHGATPRDPHTRAEYGHILALLALELR